MPILLYALLFFKWQRSGGWFLSGLTQRLFELHGVPVRDLSPSVYLFLGEMQYWPQRLTTNFIELHDLEYIFAQLRLKDNQAVC